MHAYNAGKTLDDQNREWIAAAPTPREAARRGRMMVLPADWDERVRFEVMAAVLYAKFTFSPRRTEELLSTGDAVLINTVTDHDQTWGDCRCGRPECVEPGENHLGRLLMELRSQLR